MTVHLDHTIVHSHEPKIAAAFLAAVLCLPDPQDLGAFVRVELADGVCLDYHEAEEFHRQHYALLVDDAAFDAMLERMGGLGLEYYAQGRRRGAHEITERSGGGRAVYFPDPDETSFEVQTRHFVP